ncbi:hypothetical protein Tco_0413991 [Tanacetum coccineum]
MVVDPDPDLTILRFYDTVNQKRSGSYIGSLTASIEAPYMGHDIRVADRIFDKGLWDFSVVSLLLDVKVATSVDGVHIQNAHTVNADPKGLWLLLDGKVVMVDNRYLKANYPLLVRLSTSDTHSSLRDNKAGKMGGLGGLGNCQTGKEIMARMVSTVLPVAASFSIYSILPNEAFFSRSGKVGISLSMKSRIVDISYKENGLGPPIEIGKDLT